MSETVLFITRCNFPNGDANAVRQYSLAQMFLKLGYRVELLSLTNNNSNKGTYNGINYQLFSSIETLVQYAKSLPLEKYRFVMLNDLGKLRAFWNLKQFFLKKGLSLIHDCVEWYSKEEFSKRYLSRTLWRKDLLNRFLLSKGMNVISISNYLYKYYKNKWINSIYIPVVFDFSDNSWQLIASTPLSTKLIITYSGSPQTSHYKKDALKEMFAAISLLDKDSQEKLHINIVGLEEKDFVIESKVNSTIKFHGKVSREESMAILRQSHFSILLRPVARYSMAGFSTKFAESLSLGVPMIANLTSDIGNYLHHLENGIVVSDFSIVSIYEALEQALSLPPEEWQRLSRNAKRTGYDCFDINQYITELKNFLKEAR
ncbi:glycosyltransferase [Streptococcus sp. S784/96/1]|uniref:glycosyltransferase n=1 Tax=Streptococcus sp. S784/96/1 TaxID=2653499 RepID=UPI001386985D|nr:glycosyltransferase [Streptococcus sp. S784/96/1]